MMRATALVLLVALFSSHAQAQHGVPNGNQSNAAETGPRKGILAVAEVGPPPQDVGDALEAWDRIKRSIDVSELEAFVARYKDTFLANLARRRIEQLRSQRVVPPGADPPPAPPTPSK